MNHHQLEGIQYEKSVIGMRDPWPKCWELHINHSVISHANDGSLACNLLNSATLALSTHAQRIVLLCLSVASTAYLVVIALLQLHAVSMMSMDDTLQVMPIGVRDLYRTGQDRRYS